MRLINTETLHLNTFPDPPFSTGGDRYAILSHRWQADEVSMEDYVNACAIPPSSASEEIRCRSGYQKVINCCDYARRRGVKWVWIDTCCIDKRSSAELSEAINSMWTWYSEAWECYVYLADVPDRPCVGPEALERFRSSVWFTRAWTLQELIAPSKLVFCTRAWEKIDEIVKVLSHSLVQSGLVTGLVREIANVTQIPSEYLFSKDLYKRASIAEKMRWAAYRQATREEDIAYSLVGLFGVNMSPFYGEKKLDAFHRLQRKVIAHSDDESIFVWKQPTSTHCREGLLLAPTPDAFADSDHVIRSSIVTTRAPHIVTKKGLQIESEYRFAHLQHPVNPGKPVSRDRNLGTDLYLVQLNCEVVDPGGVRQRCELALMPDTLPDEAKTSSSLTSFLRYNERLHGHEVAQRSKPVSPQLPSRPFSVRLAKREAISRDEMLLFERRRTAGTCFDVAQKLVFAHGSGGPTARYQYSYQYTIMDIEEALQATRTRFSSQEVTRALTAFSVAVLCYANILHMMAEKDSSYASMLWGIFRHSLELYAIAAETLIDFARFVARTATALPRLQIPPILHKLPNIQSAVEEICALLLGLFRQQLEFYINSRSRPSEQSVDHPHSRNQYFLSHVKVHTELIENQITSLFPHDHCEINALSQTSHLGNNGPSSSPQLTLSATLTELAVQHQRGLYEQDTLASSTALNGQIRRTSQNEHLQRIAILKTTTPISELTDVLRLRLSLHRGVNPRSQSDLQMVWRSSVLHHWSLDQASRILIVRGSLMLRKEINAVGTVMTEFLRASGIPFFWALQTGGNRQRVVTTPTQVLQHIAHEALKQNLSTVLEATPDTFSLEHVLRAANDNRWIQIISWALQYTPLAYIVIDTTLFAGHKSPTDDISTLRKSLNELLQACRPRTTLKIALIEQQSPTRTQLQAFEDDVLNLDKIFRPGPRGTIKPSRGGGQLGVRGRGSASLAFRSQLSRQAAQAQGRPRDGVQ